MSLYFVFTIDGDWDEYFETKLPESKRKPDKKCLLTLIDRQISLAARVLNGRVLHFIHTSPLVRDFFLQPEFISQWKKMEEKGGSVGVHCHEEDLYRAWFYDDAARMEKSIGFLTDKLVENGLFPKAFRGGFMTFSKKTIPILEQNGIFMDFSCEPGRHLSYNDVLVSDWRAAPNNVYRMAYDDHRKAGDSRVFEIPLGIYIERQSLWQIWRAARRLKKKEGVKILSVLAHTYDFTSFKMRVKLKLALLILRKYGRFINAEECLKLVTSKLETCE